MSDDSLPSADAARLVKTLDGAIWAVLMARLDFRNHEKWKENKNLPAMTLPARTELVLEKAKERKEDVANLERAIQSAREAVPGIDAIVCAVGGPDFKLWTTKLNEDLNTVGTAPGFSDNEGEHAAVLSLSERVRFLGSLDLSKLNSVAPPSPQIIAESKTPTTQPDGRPHYAPMLAVPPALLDNAVLLGAHTPSPGTEFDVRKLITQSESTAPAALRPKPMTISDVVRELRKLAGKHPDAANWNRPEDHLILLGKPTGPEFNGSVSYETGDALRKGYHRGAFDLPVFAELQPGLLDKANEALPYEVLRLVVAWLQRRGYRVAGPDAHRGPIDRLADALEQAAQASAPPTPPAPAYTDFLETPGRIIAPPHYTDFMLTPPAPKAPATTPKRPASIIADQIEQMIADAEEWMKPRPGFMFLDEPYLEHRRKEDEEVEKLRESAAKAGKTVTTGLVALGESASSALTLLNTLESKDEQQARKDWPAVKVSLQETAIRVRVRHDEPKLSVRTPDDMLAVAALAEKWAIWLEGGIDAIQRNGYQVDVMREVTKILNDRQWERWYDALFAEAQAGRTVKYVAPLRAVLWHMQFLKGRLIPPTVPERVEGLRAAATAIRQESGIGGAGAGKHDTNSDTAAGVALPPATPTPTPTQPPAIAKAFHSADFAMVNWFGTEYTFALGVQSSAVRVLWEQWEKNGLGLHQETIRKAVDAERDNFRMDKTFRKHPAFGTMIQNIGDGRYKLDPTATGKVTFPPKTKKSGGIPAKSRRKPR